MFRIVENEMPVPEGCSELLQDFLEQCFNKNPVMRPSAEFLCEHPWLKNNWGALKVCYDFHCGEYTPDSPDIGSTTTRQYTVSSPCQCRYTEIRDGAVLRESP